jgi:hypothetical protein
MAEDPWAEFRVTKPTTGSDEFAEFRTGAQPTAAADFLKQVGAGLVTGTEALATFPAQAARIAERVTGAAPERRVTGFETYLRSFVPGLVQPEAEPADINKLLEGRKGIAAWLPEPQTTAGQFGRTMGEFIPSTVAMTRGPAVGQFLARNAPTQLPAAVTRGAGVSIPQAAVAGATTGAISEAAGQATEGTMAEPFARVGGALVGGTVALRAAEAAAARRAVPTIEETEKAGAQLYTQFRQAGFGFTPQASPGLATSIRLELGPRGLGDVAAEKTWRVLERFEKKPFTTPQDFQAGYQELGNVARGATEPSERLAAHIAQERLLEFLERTPGAFVSANAPRAAVEAFREANANWAAAQRAKDVSQRIQKGQLRAAGTYSGLNLENQLRSRLAPLVEPGRPSALAPAERAAVERFVSGTPAVNTLRYLGNLAGGGGGLGAVVGAGGGAGAGALVGGLTGGDPYMSALYGLAAGPAGLAARTVSNRIALARARNIETLLRSRSPLAAQTMQPVVTPAAPFAAAAAPLALQLQETGEGYPFYAPRTLGDLGR